MAQKLAVMILLLAVALALGAGCAAPGSSGGGSRQATTAPGGTQASGGTLSPGPVVTVPPDYYVEFQVNKNMISTNPYIDVIFGGGKGQIFLQKALIQVQKSDGSIETKEMVRPEGGQIAKSETVRFRGTTGTDRVVITVTILGKDYKILDKLYEFKTRP